MKGALTKKLGPLKAYQWGLIGLSVGALYYIYRSHSSGASAPAEGEPVELPGAGGPAGGGGGGVGTESAEPKLGEIPSPSPERIEEPRGEAPPPQTPIEKIKEAGEVVQEVRNVEEMLTPRGPKNSTAPPAKKRTTPHHKAKTTSKAHHKHPATARHKKVSHGKPKPLHKRVSKPAPHRAPAKTHVHPHARSTPTRSRPAKPAPKQLGKKPAPKKRR